MKNFWLMKSEPHVYSFSDLKKAKNQEHYWDGVRNYQARNFMRDEMKKGDLILFYHSSCEVPGVAGVATVNSEAAYPDFTAWDPKSPYFDPKSTPENPRWLMVDVKWSVDFPHYVSLQEIKAEKKLEEMRLVQKGNRLSIMPILKEEFEYICKMGAAWPLKF